MPADHAFPVAILNRSTVLSDDEAEAMVPPSSARPVRTSPASGASTLSSASCGRTS